MAQVENQSQKREKRDANGRWLPGHCGGPGRPIGSTSINIFHACRKRAKAEGRDLREMVWEVARAMYEAAVEERDPAAAKIFLDRMGGPVEKGASVEVNVATQVNAGPPPPAAGSLAGYLEKLNTVAKAQGLVEEASDGS